MGEFFKPWRRKFGCLTLVMALVFTCGWIRSLSNFEMIHFPIGGKRHITLASRKGILYLDEWEMHGVEQLYWTLPIDTDPFEGSVVRQRWSWLEFQFGDGYIPTTLQTPFVFIAVPYWSIVIPLTALSAYLLLSKPRKKPDAEALPETAN